MIFFYIPFLIGGIFGGVAICRLIVSMWRILRDYILDTRLIFWYSI